MSNVAGNIIPLKNLQRLRIILDAHKIKYTEIDISLEENTSHKETMKSKSKSKKPLLTPQLFLDGEYVADFELVEEWNEHEELKQQLP